MEEHPGDRANGAAVKQQVRRHFASLAGEYGLRNYEAALERGKYPDIYMRHVRILEMLREQPAGTILEIGVGGGQLLGELRSRGHEVYGADLSPEMAAGARDYVAGLHQDGAARLAAADIEHLCFRDGLFDVVVAAGVIEYLPDPAQALSEIARVLRDGGIAIVSIRNRLSLCKPLVALRNLLEELPVTRRGVQIGMTLLHRVLGRAPYRGPVFARRDFPWRFAQDLRRRGLEPLERAFYHFSVFPEPAERRFPRLSIPVGMRLERLSRSPLGYLGRGCIFMVRKRSPHAA